MSQANLLRYLRDCRHADGGESGVWNLFSSSVWWPRSLLSVEDLLDGTTDGVLAPDGDWLEKVRRAAVTHRRERQLVFGTLFVVGTCALPSQPRRKKMCAPLFVAPASAETDPAPHRVETVRVDMNGFRVNAVVLEALLDAQQGAPDSSEVLANLRPPPWKKVDILQLSYQLQSWLPDIDWSALRDYPAQRDRKELEGACDKKLKALPASVLCVVENTPLARGILFELDQMAADGVQSKALDALLGASVAPELVVGPVNRVPAILSRAQEQALASAARHPLTVLVGPPGTGKSYTLVSIALDHMIRGETVLMVTRSQSALDVLADKLEAMVGSSGFVVRGGRGEHKARLRTFLDRILEGRRIFGEASAQAAKTPKELAALRKQIEKTEAYALHSISRAQRWGELSTQAPVGWWQELTHGLVKRRVEGQLGRREALWETMDRYEQALATRISSRAALMRALFDARLTQALAGKRKEIRLMNKALRSQNSGLQEQRFEALDLDAIFEVFPVWMSDVANLHRLLPLRGGLFDVVLIDEATHCDPASCLPAVVRGKRTVITGDPRQLRHISFLSGAEQDTFAARHGIAPEERALFDYRKKSLLDVGTDAIVDQEQIVFLDEHFRSRPHIISFSNARFYEGDLRVMTWRPGATSDPCVHLHMVGGCREKSGANPEEARALVDHLAARVEREEGTSDALRPTMGVISPFRAQVDCLRELLAQRLGTRAMVRHDLLIDTPHGFQGHERDLIYLSLAVSPEDGAATLRYLAREDVLNVAITRARTEQRVFASREARELPSGHLLAAYLDSVGQAPLLPEAERVAPDAFLAEVTEVLGQRGCTLHPAFPLAGTVIDLVAVREGCVLGIDLVGHPGPYAAAYPLGRTQVLRRAGMRLFPLSFFDWKTRQDQVLEALDSQLNRS